MYDMKQKDNYIVQKSAVHYISTIDFFTWHHAYNITPSAAAIIMYLFWCTTGLLIKCKIELGHILMASSLFAPYNNIAV